MKELTEGYEFTKAQLVELEQLRTTLTEQAARIQQLEDALRQSKETLMHYQYGGSNYKKPADKAIAKINELIGE